MNDHQLYSQAWLDYRKLRNGVVGWIVAFATVPLCVAYVSTQIVGSLLPGFVLAFITMGGSVYSVWQLITWSCPRCGEAFGAPLRRRCPHCRLMKWDCPEIQEPRGGDETGANLSAGGHPQR